MYILNKKTASLTKEKIKVTFDFSPPPNFAEKITSYNEAIELYNNKKFTRALEIINQLVFEIKTTKSDDIFLKILHLTKAKIYYDTATSEEYRCKLYNQDSVEFTEGDIDVTKNLPESIHKKISHNYGLILELDQKMDHLLHKAADELSEFAYVYYGEAAGKGDYCWHSKASRKKNWKEIYGLKFCDLDKVLGKIPAPSKFDNYSKPVDMFIHPFIKEFCDLVISTDLKKHKKALKDLEDIYFIGGNGFFYLYTLYLIVNMPKAEQPPRSQ